MASPRAARAASRSARIRSCRRAVYHPEIASIGPTDLSLEALDRANAALRRGLIALHEAVEAAGDLARHREIVALYGEMAEKRRLDLPPLPAR